MNTFNPVHRMAKLAISFLLSCVSFLAEAQIVTTVAGGAGGYLDTTVSKVKFNKPWGIVADNFGNIYVADRNNNRIRKIFTDGTVSTFAGNGIAGYANGQGTDAEFYAPNLLAIDADNNIYVADQGNHRIRKITPSGFVTNFAGNGTLGYANGQAANAEFNRPSGVAVDAAKNVYVADQWNNVIRKISASGVVTTLAGSIQGYQDGTSANARFNGPNGITVDNQGNVFVAEIGNSVIRKITPAGGVTTFAGRGYAGDQDGVGTNAAFYGPLGLTTDAQNNLYLADLGNNRIRKITPERVVTTLAGNDTTGFIDGTGANAKFYDPFGIAIDSKGNLYAADAGNNSIRKITMTGNVTTLAGNGLAGYENGLAANAELFGPNGVTVDGQGNIYVAEWLGNRIRKITPAGIVTTIAGTGIAGYADGPSASAQFDKLSDIVIDNQGNLFVTEGHGNRIRKITPAGIVSTLAGNGVAGFADGQGTNAEFWNINRLVFDKQGNLIVADARNNRIRKVTPAGVVSTVAGNGNGGYSDGPAMDAEFRFPNGVAIDAAGNIYVADYNNNLIRKIGTDGFVTTVAGDGFAGYANGTGTNAEFNHPGDIAINAEGDFFISDESANRIRKMTAAGVVSNYAGNGAAGLVDGNADVAEFNDVRALCVDAAGNVYVPDYNNNKIRKIVTAATIPELPVVLLNFSVRIENRNTILNWQTVSEENTNHFIIQRSINGNNFSNVSKIPAAGNSNSIKNYTCIDSNVVLLGASKLYYRLQEVDRDGKSSYSDIRTVNFSNAHALFSVFPNPAKDFINVVSVQPVKNAEVEITDMNGKMLYAAKQSFVTGQQIKISLPPVATQTLIVTIKDEHQLQQFKVVCLPR